jgi:hypothetical protein
VPTIATTATATATLAANGIKAVGKTLELDLLGLLRTLDPRFEYFAHDKLEGLAVIDGGHKLMVSSDSDFGVAALANAAPPFTLRAKVVPTTGHVDTGDVLVVDLKRLSSPPSTATVAIRVMATSSAAPTTRRPNEVPATRSSGPRGQAKRRTSTRALGIRARSVRRRSHDSASNAPIARASLGSPESSHARNTTVPSSATVDGSAQQTQGGGYL